jgi:hypothetical protein
MNFGPDGDRRPAGKVLNRVLALSVGLMLALAAGQATAGECVESGVVKRAAGSFAAASRDGSASAYTAALTRHTSMSGLALFALGPYRNSMTGARRGEYVRLTGQFMGRMMVEYGSRIVQGALVIEGCFKQNGATMVKSRFGLTQVTWRVDGRRISDVNVEGIWLASRLRSTFVGVLRRAGGDLGALLSYLRDG